MTDTPYPAGTRVVCTWHPRPQYMGHTGTCTGLSGRSGEHPFKAGVVPCGAITQAVEWDDGKVSHCTVAWLRPLSDPDAEPVVERQEETA